MPPVRTADSLPVPGHVIRVGGAIALFPLLRERGIDPEALAAEAGLSAQVFDDLAAVFALSRRTLACRLNEHGTSFNALLDEARFFAARNLVQSSQVPIAKIAARLGYSDTPTFTRAFRRWAGTTPTQWRHTNRSI